MRGIELLNRFDFHNQPAIDQQIDPEGVLKAESVKFYVDRPLPLDNITSTAQPTRKHCLVNALEQARPELSMQPEGCIDNISADLVDVPQVARSLCVSART